MRLPRDNNAAEIAAYDAVCERLAGFDSRLSAEWLDGYIHALAAGPRLPPLDDWLAKAADDAWSRAFADPADQAQALQALRTRQVVVADQLDAEAMLDDPGLARLAPLIEVWTDADREQLRAEGASAEMAAAHVTGGTWADGFFAGVADWWPDDDDAEGRELLGVVAALQRAEPDGTDRDLLIEMAFSAVQDLRLHWIDRAPVPATRRVEPRPGRNDPCPCGSGRKFKKCHGA